MFLVQSVLLGPTVHHLHKVSSMMSQFSNMSCVTIQGTLQSFICNMHNDRVGMHKDNVECIGT